MAGNGEVAETTTEPTASDGDEPPVRFETKRGECRFEDDELVLEESLRGYFENLRAGYWESDRLWHKFVFVGFVLALPIGTTIVAIGVVTSDRGVVAELWPVAVLAVLWALLYVVQRFGRGFTSTPRIPLDAIEDVTLASGSWPLTRPRFVVRFLEDGSLRKRYVLLPSLGMPHGEETLERAARAFEERGYRVDRT